MKTIPLFLFLVFAFSFNLTGQTDRHSNRFNHQKSDTIFSTPFLNNPSFPIPDKKFDLYSDRIIKPDIDLIQKHFNIESPGIKLSNDTLSAERYPGSDRFYAKSPYLPYMYEKSFIKKPDTKAKYFLIIKDPISNKIIN